MKQTLIRVNKDTKIVNFLTIPNNDYESFLESHKEDETYDFYLLDNAYYNLDNIYKFIDNELVIDKESTDNEKYFLIKEELKRLLSETDFLVLPDYSLKFNEIELKVIYDFRNSLREAKTEIPTIPDLVKKYL